MVFQKSIFISGHNKNLNCHGGKPLHFNSCNSPEARTIFSNMPHGLALTQPSQRLISHSDLRRSECLAVTASLALLWLIIIFRIKKKKNLTYPSSCLQALLSERRAHQPPIDHSISFLDPQTLAKDKVYWRSGNRAP